jgi:hypothetical protein
MTPFIEMCCPSSGDAAALRGVLPFWGGESRGGARYTILSCCAGV